MCAESLFFVAHKSNRIFFPLAGKIMFTKMVKKIFSNEIMSNDAKPMELATFKIQRCIYQNVKGTEKLSRDELSFVNN